MNVTNLERRRGPLSCAGSCAYLIVNSYSLLTRTRIAIKGDLPPPVMTRRNELYPVLKYAQSQGKRAFFSYDRLVVVKVSYDVGSLDKLRSALDLDKVGTRIYKDVHCFFTKYSPLSNFYPCELTHNSKMYHSSEQFF